MERHADGQTDRDRQTDRQTDGRTLRQTGTEPAGRSCQSMQCTQAHTSARLPLPCTHSDRIYRTPPCTALHAFMSPCSAGFSPVSFSLLPYRSPTSCKMTCQSKQNRPTSRYSMQRHNFD